MSELAVTGLTLSHFRSHKTARLSFDGRPVAVYGANGAGKTNILEAVSMLSPGRGLRRAQAEEMIRRPEAVGWKVSAVVRRFEQMHEIETWVARGNARQVRINEKAAAQVALGRIVPMVWLVPVMDRLWVEGAEGRRRFLDRLVMSFEPSHAEAVLTYEKAMRERNRMLKDGVRDAHWYDALEAQMAQAGVLMTQSRQAGIAALVAAQAEATTSFPVADLSLSAADEASNLCEASDLQAAFAQSRGRDQVAGRTLVGPHRADLQAIYAAKGVLARDCSTGEQKALLVSLILANGRALAASSGAPPVLLLDEVAAHLDAERRAALYDEICALGVQAFMTGTGADLFGELGARAQAFHVCDGKAGSVVSSVSLS